MTMYASSVSYVWQGEGDTGRSGREYQRQGRREISGEFVWKMNL